MREAIILMSDKRRKAGLLSPRHKEQTAIDLIGNAGFDGTDKIYGIIKSLSPVFILKQGGYETTFCLPEGKLKQDSVVKNFSKEEAIKNGNQSLLDFILKKPLLDEFTHQINGDGELKSIFNNSQQVGIQKKYNGQIDDDSFFKQTFIQLKKTQDNIRYSFAFYAEFTVDAKSKFEGGMIPMGGDQSLFRFEISDNLTETEFEKIEKNNQILINNATDEAYYKIILLSDCKTDNNIFGENNCYFGITDIREFRYINTSVTTQRFSNVGGKNDMNKSKKQELLSRSSVLFVKGKQPLMNVCEKIDAENKRAYKNIGYNHYKIVI